MSSNEEIIKEGKEKGIKDYLGSYEFKLKTQTDLEFDALNNLPVSYEEVEETEGRDTGIEKIVTTGWTDRLF